MEVVSILFIWMILAYDLLDSPRDPTIELEPLII